jgi:hypothetical protein
LNAVEGGCLCGSVAFRYEGAPNWTLHCHCESCRRATSSPMTTWISVPRYAFAFTKGAPRAISGPRPGSGEGSARTVGSPLTYESERVPGEVHLYAASLLDPCAVSPSRHVFTAEQLPWLEVLDDLPRYATTSRGGATPLGTGPRRS